MVRGSQLITLALEAFAAVGGLGHSDEACPLELKMFERDVAVSRETHEQLLWKLAGAGYKRRVMKSCTAKERRAALGKLKLTPDELSLLNIPSG
jgi:hypothetical protein